MENQSTESAFTSGRWNVVSIEFLGADLNCVYRIQDNSPFPDVANVFFRDLDWETEANARPIAKAPEMLADGQTLYDAIQYYHFNVDVTDSNLPEELTAAFDRFEVTWNVARGLA